MRKPIIAGNWKMHMTVDEAKAFVQEVDGLVPSADQVDTVICAPFTHLSTLTELVQERPIAIGAQNMYFEEQGAFTGEISPVMLSSLGVTYVILGHSERRQYFNETDELVNAKAKAAHQHKLIPIICVGENLEEREKDETKEVVQKQLIGALQGLSSAEASASVIAYEPVWAIGTGKSSTAEDAGDVISFIRSIVEDQYDQQVASAVRIQYGGSVKPENIAEYMAHPDIDGALVGGASLKPTSFLQLLEGRS
ncbi:triose-phosphate isomerase [Bacillus horti]|uniref:Triosephosphate isomerase n=1 Tax=Caldalkalibacillus horti TaxID=77523 RepID=A0ABT9W3Q9_9BACI|nr:triose-phosphate isomerase [Bacillus horti]MDQ0167704.1 triosephosphate isomerase [Bacillus horti]